MFTDSLRLAVIFACFMTVSSAGQALATPVQTKTGASLETGTGVASLKGSAKYNPKALHRFDFRVVGKSCAICLLGIQQRMSQVPGAVTVAVQTRAPYNAVAIYDSSKTSAAKLLEKGKADLTGIEFEDQVDKPIDKVPLVVIPRLAPSVASH